MMSDENTGSYKYPRIQVFPVISFKKLRHRRRRPVNSKNMGHLSWDILFKSCKQVIFFKDKKKIIKRENIWEMNREEN